MFQDVEGNGRGFKHEVVKLLNGKPVSEFGFCFLTQFDNLQLSNHVRASLTGPHRISFDLAGFDSIIDGLLPSPMLPVNAGINDQTPSPKKLRIEFPKYSL